MDRIPVPQDFCCSITGDVMADPVCTVDGHTYERGAIRQWFGLGNRTSPKTNAVLHSTEVTPNHALRCAIEAYLKERPEIERHRQDVAYACEVHEDEVALKLSRKEAEIQELRNDFHSGMEDPGASSSAERFEDLSLTENLLRGVYSDGLERPSRIQKLAIQPMVSGQDVVARAMYGWGNTTAFVIGALQVLDSSGGPCQAVILVRTPEVARKVYMKCLRLGQNLEVHCDLRYSEPEEEADDAAGTKHLVVMTLQDCVQLLLRGEMPLEGCRLLVLDEVDKMMQRAEEEIYGVLRHLPRFTQLALFLDAGKEPLPTAIELFKARMMRSPVEISGHMEPLPVYHFCVYVDEAIKLDWFCDFYENNMISQFVFFCNTARKVRWLRDQLVDEGFSVSMLYGQLDSSQRDRTLSDFCCGHARVLVTTDNIAKRGYDFPHVRVVINYDVADCPDIYHHRARSLHYFAGRGVVISLAGANEETVIHKIEDQFQIRMPNLPMLPNFVSDLLT